VSSNDLLFGNTGYLNADDGDEGYLQTLDPIRYGCTDEELDEDEDEDDDYRPNEDDDEEQSESNCVCGECLIGNTDECSGSRR